ncbi:hypothetical protein KSX_54700 [Ktedonospora formicarum]|uniref:Uncharacterized protein n=1 Tax=Ktedonospora formicarum TaxID=2778364 RepID=A0A8J3MSP8_9CHLR|nr:hypothetical protein KSX_54700 [Ktedonospora formicarum]
MLCQPITDCCDDALLVLVVSFWQLERLGKLQQAQSKALGSFCPNPEDGTVRLGEPVDILQGNLRLPNATQPMERVRMGERLLLISVQRGVK